ncbi:MAG: FtsX-like permease family protein, partial [Acidobacteria bacterium]|nr:FtsX-like permease family protein [Acidobacteriota bacterium]
VGGENGWRIVGVVGDVKQKEATAPAPAHVYLPLGTPLPPRPFTLLVRSALPRRDLVAGVRRVLAAVDKDVPPYQVRTMDEVIASAFDGARFQTFVLLAFASAALVLALVGIYGVISYSVAQRTREIGIRVATGAARGDILRLVVGRVGQLSALGILIGCAAAFVLSAPLQPLLFETRALDPLVFLGVALVLVLTAAMGSALPARRAANVDPAISLRQD